MKATIQWAFVLLTTFMSLNVYAEIQRTAPIRDSKLSHANFPPFYFWQKAKVSGSYRPFILESDGTYEAAPHFKEIPQFDQKDASVGIFWPDSKYSGKALEESIEVISPDGRWSIKTYGIKTFADDLNNTHLIVRDFMKDTTFQIKIPTHSMGTLYPLFWHPTSRTFYFMVMKGEVASRTFGLWQYDPVQRTFCNIGTTDGRAFLSPDGEWIVWETGLLSDECDSPVIHHIIQLMAYHISESISYQLTKNQSMNLFHGWTYPKSRE
jgi:hypothetical protein